MTSSIPASLWPPAGVRVTAGDLELRWIDDDLIVPIAQLAADGIHDAATMPFLFPWTRGSSLDVARSLLTFQWSTRSVTGPDQVRLEYAVIVDGTPVGVQGAATDQWAATRSMETGSWLGRSWQGRGIGTRMRVLMLHLLFEGLGAAEVTSEAFADNPASNAVSLKVGYEPNGQRLVAREGSSAVGNRYRIDRARWMELRDAHAALAGAEIRLDGAQALRDHLAGAGSA